MSVVECKWGEVSEKRPPGVLGGSLGRAYSDRLMPALTYRTLISPPVPVAGGRLLPNGDKRMFSPLTTTLITGDRDAVLVDPPLTSDQSAAVGDWIDDS